MSIRLNILKNNLLSKLEWTMKLTLNLLGVVYKELNPRTLQFWASFMYSGKTPEPTTTAFGKRLVWNITMVTTLVCKCCRILMTSWNHVSPLHRCILWRYCFTSQRGIYSFFVFKDGLKAVLSHSSLSINYFTLAVYIEIMHSPFSTFLLSTPLLHSERRNNLYVRNQVGFGITR